MRALLTRFFLRLGQAAVWREARLHVKEAREHLPTPNRKGTPDQQYAWHYQYQHINMLRLERGSYAFLSARD